MVAGPKVLNTLWISFGKPHSIILDKPIVT